jgi:WD40 repeat protein
MNRFGNVMLWALVLGLGSAGCGGAVKPPASARTHDDVATPVAAETLSPALQIPRNRMTHDGVVTSVAYSPDGKTLASGGQDGTIKLWDVATGKERATFQGHPVSDWVTSVAYSPDGKTLASGSGETIKLWDVATGKEQATLNNGHTASVKSVTYSPDGKTLASAGRDQTIKLWDVATGREKATLKGHTQT